MEDFTQDNRPISISTDLGKDKLLLTHFTYEEQFNQCFSINAFVQSEDMTLSLDSLIGTQASISMITGQGGRRRYFHGVIDEVTQTGRVPGLADYTLTLVPWFALLRRTSDAKIFQHKSVPDIVKEVLESNSCPQAEFKIMEGDYPKLEFCVQYLEDSHSFVCRLLERAGIAWYFRHEENRHTLVLTDSVVRHTSADGYEAIPYRETSEQGDVTECIHGWEYRGSERTGIWAHTDFDFTNPHVVASQVPGGVLAAKKLEKLPHTAHGQRKWFDYPGGYTDTERGTALATVRLEALQAFHRMGSGHATAMGLTMGALFKLEEHPRKDQNREYLITRVDIDYDAGAFSSDQAEGTGFKCTFDALDTKIPFRPALSIDPPRIHGPQTAIVTGPTGGQIKNEEEIYTDEYGRVKVHFHWDRHLDYDHNSSCWVRVAQVWAGQGWGGMHIPRIGQEVIVEFLNGDPDYPIITGRVYNKQAMPPYRLPDKRNVSGLRSKTNPGGAAPVNFNEIYMDDTKGEELLHIQAEKDRSILVKHDNEEDVGNDETITIGHDRTKHVKANETTNVDGNRTEEVGKNETITIQANRTEEVKKNEDITIGENRTEQVGKNEEVQIGKNRTHQIKEVDKLEVGKKLLVDVGDEIVIRTGKASIIMRKNGFIELSGVDISVIGKGEIILKATKDITIKGKKVKEN
jgi:type VI secretion system secreted protein VgrG